MRICKGIVLSFCIVLCVFPFVSFAAGEVTLVPFSSGVSISADTAGMGGSGTFTDIGSMSIIEGGVGNIKSGTITITAPAGFEFDTTNPATVTVTSSTSNPETNINHLVSGTIAPTITTAGAISFTVTSQSTSARNTLTWNSVNIRPIDVVSIPSSDIILSSTDNIIGLTLPMGVGSVSEIHAPSESVVGTLIDNVTINTDTVWTKAGNPYIIGPNVKIQNATLTVEHGVQIIITNEFNTPINVQGKVVINGTKEDPVMMTSEKKNLLDGQIGFFLNSSSEFNARWFTCTDIYMCINQTEGVKVYINHGNFNNTGVAVAYDMSGVIDIKNSYFRNSNAGIFGYFGRNPERSNTAFVGSKATIRITRNYFEGMVNAVFADIFGAQGLKQEDVEYFIESNTFKNISSKAGEFYTDSNLSLSVGANYYGDPSGPRSIDNPNGLGVKIYYGGGMVIQPWLTEEVFPDDSDGTPPPPKDPEPLPACCSSVMFFPGIEGSRLYMKRDNGSEDQLWEPNIPADVADLYANSDGTSINTIYTKDIIKETNIGLNIPQLRRQVYKAFSEDLDVLVSTNKIHEWQSVPYDWRMGVDDVVDNGIVLENTTENIITEVERMAHESDTGKVSLVGHSNGGLMIKYLVKKLEDKGEVNLIDSVVLVGSPELGTPKGLIAVLHGIDFHGPLGLLAPQSHNRELAVNIAGAYGLIPSEKFFEHSTTPIVTFDSSLNDIDGFVDGYGKNVDTYGELKDFLLSNNDTRNMPGFSDVDNPAIGNNALYKKSESLHAVIDNYSMPYNIKTYEISGIGLSTVSGVVYKSEEHCFVGICTDSLIPEMSTTIEGDNTVINISSAIMSGTRYFVDMNKYNKDNNKNYGHAEMFENNSIKTLVKNIITDTNATVPYVVDKSVMPTIKTKRIGMHSPVNIHVYDSQGRHTGPCVDPEHPDMVCIDEEIPNSSYMIIGEDTHITIPGEGVYTLHLDGYDTGTFTLNIDDYENDTVVDSVVFTDISTTADTTSIVDLSKLPKELLLDNNNDNNPDIRVDNNSQTTDLHPRTVTIQTVQPNNGGRPAPIVLVDEKQPLSVENKKIVVQVKKKSVIIKKPVQVAKKETPTIIAVAKVAPTPFKPKLVPVIIPMTANVGGAIDFDLWTYLEELFTY